MVFYVAGMDTANPPTRCCRISAAFLSTNGLCSPTRRLGGRKHRGRAYEVLMNSSHARMFDFRCKDHFQIQEAIQHWHSQDAMHAFTHAPDLLIRQISRFLHTDRGIRKTRQSFHIQRHIEVPAFVDHAGTVEQKSYTLCGGVLHII